jgi:hypothetical protein
MASFGHELLRMVSTQAIYAQPPFHMLGPHFNMTGHHILLPDKLVYCLIYCASSTTALAATTIPLC